VKIFVAPCRKYYRENDEKSSDYTTFLGALTSAVAFGFPVPSNFFAEEKYPCIFDT
jgi:hypothetical protein